MPALALARPDQGPLSSPSAGQHGKPTKRERPAGSFSGDARTVAGPVLGAPRAPPGEVREGEGFFGTSEYPRSGASAGLA